MDLSPDELEASLRSLQESTLYPRDWEDARASCGEQGASGKHLPFRVGPLYAQLTGKNASKSLLDAKGEPTTLPTTLWLQAITKNWCEACLQNIAQIVKRVHDLLTPREVQAALKTIYHRGTPKPPARNWAKVRDYVPRIAEARRQLDKLQNMMGPKGPHSSLGATLITLERIRKTYTNWAEGSGQKADLEKQKWAKIKKLPVKSRTGQEEAISRRSQP